MGCGLFRRLGNTSRIHIGHRQRGTVASQRRAASSLRCGSDGMARPGQTARMAADHRGGANKAIGGMQYRAHFMKVNRIRNIVLIRNVSGYGEANECSSVFSSRRQVGSANVGGGGGNQ